MSIISVAGMSRIRKLKLLHELWDNQAYARVFDVSNDKLPEFNIDEASSVLGERYIHYLCGKPMMITMYKNYWDMTKYDITIMLYTESTPQNIPIGGGRLTKYM